MTEKQCDKLVDYFNGQMDDMEKEAFETHLAGCASCQEELAEWEALSSDLPYLSTPADPPEGMKKRVLDNVFAEEEEPALPQKNYTESKVKKNRFTKFSSPWVMGTAAAVLLLSLVGNGILWSERQDLASETERLSEEAERLAFERDLAEQNLATVLEEEEEGGVSDVLLASNLASIGEAEFSGQGSATIISENGELELLIQVTDMPELQGSEAFQAWVIEGEVPIPAGSFTIDENGNGAVSYNLNDMEDTQIDQIAISLEPQPNSLQPQGEILLASQ
ncbi:anti-sigma factor [Alkalicoccus daliensis]|uniref:Anti-sigma-W factor RsiW n=1 Tax=Alkalicoccus daliensis TaxID=745820 RepID=A0A1H0KID8_9BACI|nr:anti-sigma factor [Alkalicoccus daliensis]SDO55530.1 Putative zinc-finger [Alkalicoccus daliensis]